MGDLALVVFFLCMLMVPCCLAARNLCGTEADRRSGDGVFAIAERYDDDGESATRFELVVDRRALALQRSREIYYRARETRRGQIITEWQRHRSLIVPIASPGLGKFYE